jgi:hypothetical protein
VGEEKLVTKQGWQKRSAAYMITIEERVKALLGYGEKIVERVV